MRGERKVERTNVDSQHCIVILLVSFRSNACVLLYALTLLFSLSRQYVAVRLIAAVLMRLSACTLLAKKLVCARSKSVRE